VVRRILFVLLIALGVAAYGAFLPQQPASQTGTLKIGDPAPDFSLPDHNGQTVKLSEFRGKQNVVLAFFVLAFTGG